VYLDPRTPIGIIQIVLIAFLVWGTGLSLTIWALVRFIRSFRTGLIRLHRPPKHSWVWVVAILVLGQTGMVMAMTIPHLYRFPITFWLTPTALLYLFALIFRVFRPFNKSEWLLPLFYIWPGSALHVIRKHLESAKSNV